MSRTSLVWLDGGSLRIARIPDRAAAVVIGRSSEAAVQLTDESVSRQHALLRITPDGDRLENLSRTNPTRVNGVRVDKAVDLADGDLLRIGSVEIGYHNLANASRVSGPICSYCKRENSLAQKDCWFCGTSLVSALSDVRTRTPLVLRAAGPPQQKPIDVFPGEILTFDAEGEASVVREEGAATDVLAIVAASEGPRLRRGADNPAATLNGAPVVGDSALSSGDRLEIGTQQMMILANVDG